MQIRSDLKDLMQRLYDKQIQALLLQGEKSSEGYVCKYRKDNTPECKIRCGIGHLIADDYYVPDLEGLSAKDEEVIQAIRYSLNSKDKSLLSELIDAHPHFLEDCQDSHDYSCNNDFVYNYAKKIREVGYYHGLTIPDSIKYIKSKLEYV